MNRTALSSSITALLPLPPGPAYAFAAHSRNLVWADPLTMWQDVARKSPMKARTHYNYAIMLAGAGGLDGAVRGDPRRGGAEPVLKGVVAPMPSLAEGHALLGEALARLGRPAEALYEFETALGLDPGHEGARQAGMSIKKTGN